MARPKDFSELREITEAQAAPSQAQAPDLLAEFLKKHAKEHPEGHEKEETPELLAEFLKKRAEEPGEQGHQEALHLQAMDDLRRDKSKNPNSRVAGLTFASFDEFDGEPGDGDDDDRSALEFIRNSKHHRPDAAENFMGRAYNWTRHQILYGVAILKNAAHNVRLAADHALHVREHPGSPHPAAFRFRDHAGSVAAVAGIAASTLLVEGFKGYLAARMGHLMEGGPMGSREDAYAGAGKAVVANAGGAVIGAALTLVPGYTSYQEVKQGNWGAALFWGAVDLAGAAAMVITLGTAGSAVEGSIFAAKMARAGGAVARVTQVAFDARRVQNASRVIEGGAKAYTRVVIAKGVYDVAGSAIELGKFLNTDQGRLLLAAVREEAFEKGATPKTLAQFARADLIAKGMPPQFADIAAKRIENNDKLTPSPTSRGPSLAALRKGSDKFDETPKLKHVPDGSPVLIPIS